MTQHWDGFFYTKKEATMSYANWVKYANLVRQIIGIGNDSWMRTSIRGNLDRFNAGTEEAPLWYSTEFIVSARFNRSIINPATIKGWLVDAFEVNPATVTYEVGAVTIAERPTAYCDYAYNGSPQLRIAFFGIATASETCTYKESNIEALAWVAAHKALWEPSE